MVEQEKKRFVESSRGRIWVLSRVFRGNFLGGLKKHEVRTDGFPAEFRADYLPNTCLFKLLLSLTLVFVSVQLNGLGAYDTRTDRK